jgi:hypothetical protein
MKEPKNKFGHFSQIGKTSKPKPSWTPGPDKKGPKAK